MSVSQLPLERWTHGVDMTIAVLPLEPDQIESVTRFKFQKDHDDLDEFTAVIVEVDGHQVVLQRHKHAPNPGTEVLVDRESDAKAEGLALLLDLLDVDRSELRWLHPAAGGLIERDFVHELHERLREECPRIQIIHGSRQVGKSTGMMQLLKLWDGPSHYTSVDDPEHMHPEWLYEHWDVARSMGEGALLIVDEYQKIENFGEVIKSLWDRNESLRLVLLGSSAPGLARNTRESLAGRFEQIYVPHWSYLEFRSAFGIGLDQYLLFGGYPGAAVYLSNFSRWVKYIRDSIVSAVFRDILEARPIRNTSALSRTFQVICEGAGVIKSYRSILNQVQGRGNVELIKSFIDLLEKAFLVKSLSKHSPGTRRLSSPKLLPLCPALHTWSTGRDVLTSSERDSMLRLAVGNDLMRCQAEPRYWKSGQFSVDYVIDQGERLIGIQVSPRYPQQGYLRSRQAFRDEFPSAEVVTVSAETYETWSMNPLGYIKSRIE